MSEYENSRIVMIKLASGIDKIGVISLQKIQPCHGSLVNVIKHTLSSLHVGRMWHNYKIMSDNTTFYHYIGFVFMFIVVRLTFYYFFPSIKKGNKHTRIIWNENYLLVVLNNYFIHTCPDILFSRHQPHSLNYNQSK